MTDPQQRLERLVKRTFHVPRWLFLFPLVLITAGTIIWLDTIVSSIGSATVPLYLLAVGSPIGLSYLQRVRSTSPDFVFYYTQRAPHEIGFHLRRKWFRQRPKLLDLEIQSSAEMCAGLRTLRTAAPSVMNISSAHFSDSGNLLKLKQLVSQTLPTELIELKYEKMTYVSAFVTRIAMHGFRWSQPFRSLAFLHAKARDTHTTGVRVTFGAPNNSFKPNLSAGADKWA